MRIGRHRDVIACLRGWAARTARPASLEGTDHGANHCAGGTPHGETDGATDDATDGPPNCSQMPAKKPVPAEVVVVDHACAGPTGELPEAPCEVGTDLCL